MLVLRPRAVSFAGAAWPGVERLAIDRLAARTVREWSGDGPYPTLVDVPEQFVRVRVVQALDASALASPRPGDLGTLRVEVSPGADEGRRLVRVACVVESVTHEVSGARAVRVVTLIAQSQDGDDDPVVVTYAS